MAKGNASKRPYRRRRTRATPAFLDEDVIDTSDTVAGKRKRAPAEGAMDSDAPTQSIDKKSRMGDLHLAFASDAEVVKGRAQWRNPEMQGGIDTHTRRDPGAPLLVDGAGAALSAWVAEGYNRTSGRELTKEEERTLHGPGV